MNVAIIGLGYIGKVHLSVLKSLPGISRIVLADEDQESARELGQFWGISDTRSSLDGIITDPEIDAVHNCTPNHVHFDINRRVLESGKHLLSEKPLCLDSKEAVELCQLAETRKRVTGVNFCYRYYPAVQEMAHRVRNGALGRILGVHGAFFQDWLLYDTDYSWRLNPEFSGISNALGDIGSHWCDLAQFVTGQKITSLIADTDIVHPVRKKARTGGGTFSVADDGPVEEVDIQLEDHASVVFRLENGALGSYSVGQICAGHKVDIDIKIFGSEGSVSWSHRRPEQLVFGYRNREQVIFLENPLQQDQQTAPFARLPSGHPMGYHDAIHNMFSEFYHECSQGRGIHLGCPDFQDGLNQIRIVEAAVRSRDTKAWVNVAS